MSGIHQPLRMDFAAAAMAVAAKPVTVQLMASSSTRSIPEDLH